MLVSCPFCTLLLLLSLQWQVEWRTGTFGFFNGVHFCKCNPPVYPHFYPHELQDKPSTQTFLTILSNLPSTIVEPQMYYCCGSVMILSRGQMFFLIQICAHTVCRVDKLNTECECVVCLCLCPQNKKGDRKKRFRALLFCVSSKFE